MATAATSRMLSHEIGESIPPSTPHLDDYQAVSVSLPTWQANVGYEEGEDWVLGKMKTGYPRFFVHKKIEAFANAIVEKHGASTEKAFLFPSNCVAERCTKFLRDQIPSLGDNSLRIVDLRPNDDIDIGGSNSNGADVRPIISAVIFPQVHAKTAKIFWQHSGDGISSRRAEYCHQAFRDGRLSATTQSKGPRRYQKVGSKPSISNDNLETKDCVRFVEERFGRNLDVSLASSAKLAIRRRIAGALTANVDLPEALELSSTPSRMEQVKGFSEDDVCLYPCGMSAIFNTHRNMLICKGHAKSISFGFPYIDTLKILEKWGPGCVFYGHGDAPDLDDLERRCESGERFLALFCEFPGNPLLKTPNLRRIRELADRYDFAVVVDETIGNFINVHVLPFADVVVSSLTKVFTGECNVMGGSAVLNPQGRYYSRLKDFMATDYEDNYWPEDAIFMERNSRDFVSRIERINNNAETICQALESSSIVKQIYYPKYSATREFYDQCRTKIGGYGGLLSVTFNNTTQAVTFFNKLETAKGPSLGTNFTLSSPYVILAHYAELPWAAQFGVEADLVRVSVGLEDSADLKSRFERALAEAARASPSGSLGSRTVSR
ncbi:Cystathionine gamma-synthase [Lecanora helva]